LTEPLVAIITPVYNGGAMLQGCIDSVIAQTYQNWILIIADNTSSDETMRIAADAAARDSRIQLKSHAEYFGILDNWNRAMSYAPDQTVYVKHLNVDDRLRPDCVRRLVEVAEAHPGVAVVSSYFMFGPSRHPRHEHDEVQIIRGRDAVIEVLRGGTSYLVHPSVLLLRRSAAVAWPRFFDSTGFPPGHPRAPFLAQADKEAYFEIMERFDLAFVPEILTDLHFTDDASATGFASRVGAWHVGRIEVILRHGDRFLDAAERRLAIKRTARRYLRSLAWRILRMTPLRDPEFVQYQRLALTYVLPRLRQEGIGWTSFGLRLAARVLGSDAKVGRALTNDA
jgi:glycosyltransferase involved in cell wall biosynthesis